MGEYGYDDYTSLAFFLKMQSKVNVVERLFLRKQMTKIIMFVYEKLTVKLSVDLGRK